MHAESEPPNNNNIDADCIQMSVKCDLLNNPSSEYVSIWIENSLIRLQCTF